MQIDIVIVSCSCFAPTPSMAAMIVNHFKLRRDVLTYNLSGMGCSSSLICIDMVKHLLKVSLFTTHPLRQQVCVYKLQHHLQHCCRDARHAHGRQRPALLSRLRCAFLLA